MTGRQSAQPEGKAAPSYATITTSTAGLIELAGGVEAFFVPARSGLVQGSENATVIACLGFSYDGPRAWDIARADDE